MSLPMPKMILVVEDDLAIRETVVELLHDEGFPNVTATRHGKDALAWLESTAELPGVILLDLMMPVMDGESLLKELQARPRLREVPVIILSASRHRTTLIGA